ncbi:hypothetical protein PN836_018340 [Ningiella sp. W23]|uniref:hypothetical protein n=1 Tax=Ningiella sp. W23 TaxID=3023715 RepID=UPI003757E809
MLLKRVLLSLIACSAYLASTNLHAAIISHDLSYFDEINVSFKLNTDNATVGADGLEAFDLDGISEFVTIDLPFDDIGDTFTETSSFSQFEIYYNSASFSGVFSFLLELVIDGNFVLLDYDGELDYFEAFVEDASGVVIVDEIGLGTDLETITLTVDSSEPIAASAPTLGFLVMLFASCAMINRRRINK